MQSFVCDECGGTLVSTESEICCSNCGTVAEQLDWPHNPGSSGLIATPKPSLGSLMGHASVHSLRDSNGRPLAPASQGHYSRLKAIYERGWREGGGWGKAAMLIEKVAKLLGLNQAVRDRALELYRKTWEKAGINRPGSPPLVALCLLQGSRVGPKPVTMREVTEAFKSSGYKLNITSLMRVELRVRELLGTEAKVPTGEDFVEKVVEKVLMHWPILRPGWLNTDLARLEAGLQAVALRLLSRVHPLDRAGRNPYILAASAVYAAGKILSGKLEKQLLTQRELANIVGVAEYSIREHYRRLFRTEVHHCLLRAT